MGMLDRLLGDLVASSTNLPPHVTRGLVRRAGGSKLLIAGGAALAGAFVAQHLHSRQAQGAAQPAVPPSPPPPPPVPPAPPAGPAGALGWSPPPLPPELGGAPAGAPFSGSDIEGEAGAEESAGEVELPPGLLFPVVRTMVAAALADGELAPSEREAIFAHLESGELTPAEVQQLRREMVLPATPGELAAAVGEREHRELLYRFGFLALRADGALGPLEGAWLAQLGTALGLEEGVRAALERDVLGEPDGA
jgi:DnaJ-domain-containing protein 1